MNRLRAYRDIEGLNQTDLAELLGMSTAMVSAIESGRRPFNGDLSSIGYGNERLELPDMSAPMHRARASTLVAAKNRAKELLRLAGEVFAELVAITPKAPRSKLLELDAVHTFQDVEERAAELRTILGQEESGPIRNLTALIERAGVCIIPIAGLAGVDGLSAWVNGVPVIGIDPSAPGDRFRFGLAHECGHLTLHNRHHDNVEREANRFAGALLFPQDDFDAAMVDKVKLQDFISLKNAWGMSIAATIYRAHELEYIDDARYRALQIQTSKWRRSEPGEFRASTGTLLPRLVEVNGGTAAVAENFGINTKHLAALINWSHLRAV
ncbi:DNA-binding protein [Mycolicibacterium litorale]|uniref:DNA-binding protein n=1 Tax=Mycolicibacterium litorale TaxID=758802 RepID=A0A6S6NZT4_9MYCO|nr:XRE family transcriptional regulator [Mycolicibacterium litorale]BCI50751.1 DNA-binding protein [Mycolicibacterium litorale]